MGRLTANPFENYAGTRAGSTLTMGGGQRISDQPRTASGSAIGSDSTRDRVTSD